MMLLGGQRRALVSLLLAGLALASGKPSWGSNGKGLTNAKSGAGDDKPGQSGLADADIDFDSVSPKDCADYLCVSSSSLASDYIESGCPGQFANFEPEGGLDSMGSFVGMKTESSTGVTTGTLLSLAGASGVFAAGMGFVVGYKASPSFAYMRIPSLA